VTLAAALLLVCHGRLAAAELDVLARVDGGPVTRAEVEASLEALPLGSQIGPREHFGRYALAVVREEVVLRRQLARQFADEPELRRQVRDVVFTYLQRKYVKNRIRVAEEDVRRYYTEHPDWVRGEHLRVRQIVRPRRAECEALRDRIASEAAFAALAREQSLDRASAAEGGDLGYLMRVKGELGFEPELFEMRPGEMRVFDSPSGCHLVRAGEYVDPPLPPLEQVRDQLRAFLEEQQEERLLVEWLREAGEAVKVELYFDPAQ
jgi:parvulin-like peptidyl-prolyl isomerase